MERLRQGADRKELRADGTTAAVIDASLRVEAGEIFVVMGLSGSGKSTLLRMLNGLLEPTAGSVRDNAPYGLEVQGVPRAERERRADEALALCGLAGREKSWPDELSSGMQLGVPPGP